MLPQGRPRSTLVRVRYATAITVDERKGFGLMFGSAGLCFERRRMMVKMKTAFAFRKEMFCRVLE